MAYQGRLVKTKFIDIALREALSRGGSVAYRGELISSLPVHSIKDEDKTKEQLIDELVGVLSLIHI